MTGNNRNSLLTSYNGVSGRLNVESALFGSCPELLPASLNISNVEIVIEIHR